MLAILRLAMAKLAVYVKVIFGIHFCLPTVVSLGEANIIAKLYQGHLPNLAQII